MKPVKTVSLIKDWKLPYPLQKIKKVGRGSAKQELNIPVNVIEGNAL